MQPWQIKDHLCSQAPFEKSPQPLSSFVVTFSSYFRRKKKHRHESQKRVSHDRKSAKKKKEFHVKFPPIMNCIHNQIFGIDLDIRPCANSLSSLCFRLHRTHVVFPAVLYMVTSSCRSLQTHTNMGRARLRVCLKSPLTLSHGCYQRARLQNGSK